MSVKHATLTYELKIDSFEMIDSSFTKAKCYLLASGRNFNYSDITKQAIIDAMPTLIYKPVIAHIIKKDDGVNKLGGHDQEIILNENGIQLIEQCIPVGLVPSMNDARPTFEKVLEEDGITENEYLTCFIYLWTGRFPELKELRYSDNVFYNQSIEIEVGSSYMDEDDYLVINSYKYEALCLLHKSDDEDNKRPCFPSSQVVRASYSLEENDFKKTYEDMMGELKSIKTEDDTASNNNETKEADDLNEKKQIVFDALKKVLSEHEHRQFDKSYCTYEILKMDEDCVYVVDRNDKYHVYSIPYLATEAEGNVIVNVNYEAKKEAYLDVNDEDSGFVFDYGLEVATISEDAANYKLETTNNIENKELKDANAELAYSLENVTGEIDRLKAQIVAFEKEKAALVANHHKNNIDNIIAQWEGHMSKYSYFMEYKADIDYKKTIEEVEKDLKLLFADYTILENNRTRKFAIETSSVKSTDIEDLVTERYGDIGLFNE